MSLYGIIKLRILIFPLLVLSLVLISCGEASEPVFVPPTISLSNLEVPTPGNQIPIEVESSKTPEPTEVLPTPTVVLVAIPTSIPTLVPSTITPTLVATPTPVSVLTPPTSTPSPILTPTPAGPSEGQLTPDGQQIYRNGAWQLLVPFTPTPIPPTAIPTPTPISVLVPPTPTPGPIVTPTPTGPKEGDLTPDGQMIFRNGAWQLVVPLTPTPVVLTPTPTPRITPTPTALPQYAVVSSQQIIGIPDSLDFSSGPTVADSKLSFSSTYVSRGLGFPTVVQLWQRNGATDAITSDANNSDCFTQKPVAFYRIAPARGMKYDKSIESNYLWTYCINEYRFNPQSLSIPWVNATSWNYNTQGVLETFTFEGSTVGLFDAWAPPGKWVVVIFSGNIILSEKVIQ